VPGVERDGAAERLRRQQLTDRLPRTPVDVVRHLLAVQAQDLTGARLAVRARSTGLLAADVDAALDARELVVSWLNRGTLHLVAAEDYGWLHELTAPRTRTANRRRLEQEGVSPAQAERGVTEILQAIERDGPQTRAQLRAVLDDAGVPTARQALVHVIGAAGLAGHIVRGPVVGGEQAFVTVPDWLGAPEVPDREEALARLATRYLTGHAPATDADLAAWAGISLGDARRGLAASGAAEPGDVEPCGQHGRWPDPVLLGPFDPVLHGWPDREWVLGGHRGVITVNGIFRPTALVSGRVVGTWKRGRGTVDLDLLEPVTEADRRVLEADGHDVTRFLGISSGHGAR